MLINYHSLFFAIGVMVGLMVYFSLNKKEVSSFELTKDYFWSFVFGLFGARLFYALFSGLYNPIEWFSFWRVGLISYGGILFALITLYVRRHKQKNFHKLIDTFAISASLAWSVGRIGNFLNKDAFGVLNYNYQQFYDRVPIQLFESLVVFIIFIISLWLYRKNNWSGQILWINLTLYGFARFIIDYNRDLPTILLEFNISQLIALLIGICGIIVISYEQRKKKSTFVRRLYK